MRDISTSMRRRADDAVFAEAIYQVSRRHDYFDDKVYFQRMSRLL